MFRVQNNVPNVYIDESRDFQLIARLIDVAVNGTRFDINTLSNILDPFKTNDRMLELLSTKVGFFAKYSYDSRLLRYAISAFPYILKNKGSKKGITDAISVILKVDGIVDTPQVYIDNKNFVITIYTGTKIYNKVALLDILSYIIPIGYTYNIEEATRFPTDLSTMTTDDNISYMINPSVSNSQVRGSDRILGGSDTFDFSEEMEDKYIGTYNITEVIGSDNFTQSVDNDGDVVYDNNKGTKRDTIDAWVEDGKIKSAEGIVDKDEFIEIKENIIN